MTIYRKYDDEDEWGSIKENEAHRILAQFYNDIDVVWEALEQGEFIRTTSATYQMVNDDNG